MKGIEKTVVLCGLVTLMLMMPERPAWGAFQHHSGTVGEVVLNYVLDASHCERLNECDWMLRFSIVRRGQRPLTIYFREVGPPRQPRTPTSMQNAQQLAQLLLVQRAKGKSVHVYYERTSNRGVGWLRQIKFLE